MIAGGVLAAGWLGPALLRAAGPEGAGHSLSLVRNGDFSRPDPADTNKPAFWDKPDGLGVQWVDAPADPEANGQVKAIRMDTAVTETAMVAQWRKMGIEKWDIPAATNSPVAATYGLSFYSDAMPVRSGQAYRVSFKVKGASGGTKVWVRGYGLLRGQERRLYETLVNCRNRGGGWTAFARAFNPTAHTPQVTSMRVMLYAYWPPGVYWFKDVAIVPISLEDWKADLQATED